MPAYITLASFTDQGARNIKDSPTRFGAFKAAAEAVEDWLMGAAAEAAGVTVKSVHWTTGAYDLVLIVEGPEEAVMKVALKTAALGNVRTQTLRGFSIDEMTRLVGG